MLKSDLADIGDISAGATVEVKWELTCDPTEVVHFQPDCGCTAKLRTEALPEGNFIIAEFTEGDAQKLSQDQRDNWYPSGKMPVTKGVWVYFKDDKDLFIINEHNKQVVNPEKKRQKISFIGYVNLVKVPNQLTLKV